MVRLDLSGAGLLKAWEAERTEVPSGGPGARPRHFLLLRGPFGPFFRMLADALGARGCRVTKVNFDSGDVVAWGLLRPAVQGPVSLEATGPWLSKTMTDLGVTDLVCFNDCVEPHPEAIVRARALGIAVHVFEEGYFRPHWITLDRGGVNARSALPKDPEFYRQAFDKTQGNPLEARDVGAITRGLVFATIGHYAGKLALAPISKPRQTPFALSPVDGTIGYNLMYARAMLGLNTWPKVEAALLSGDRPYFLALVQKSGDTQLAHNSDYSNETFIEATLTDFAANAPQDAVLAFKLHPMESRMRFFRKLVVARAASHGLAERVVVLDGGNLNALSRGAVGAVTVNSTAGLAAVGFGCPVKVLGRAFYDIPGLTHQGPLSSLWSAPEKPDPSLFSAFRWTVMARTQINGSYFTPLGRSLAVEVAAQRLVDAGDPQAGA